MLLSLKVETVVLNLDARAVNLSCSWYFFCTTQTSFRFCPSVDRDKEKETDRQTEEN